MRFPTYIQLPFQEQSPLPEKFQRLQIRYPPNLVEYFLETFTKERDMVFDPFVGFGTTLTVAKNMNRQVFGTEIHQDRVHYLHQIGLQEVKHGDILKISAASLPEINFLMTSPPFMGNTETADALTGYQFAGTYDKYLEKLKQIFQKIKSRLLPNATVIVEVSNLKDETGTGDLHITPLAWDIGNQLAKVLTFQGEVIIAWEGKRKRDGIYGHGYDHSYCLVYKK